MVYVDSSVALAHLLSEDVRPPDAFWKEALIASRLLEYEVAVRINARRAGAAGRQAAADLLQRIALLELIPDIVERAREPFPLPVRTLDALHVASVSFLMAEGVDVELATYDERMRVVARKLKIPLFELR
jgi:predicted nucleic acid-binding protein